MSKVTIINFSGRKNGNCHNIASVITQTMTANFEVTVKEMHNLNITPCGRCEYECFTKTASCPYKNDDIIGLYNAVCSSNLAIFIIPNYVDYPNANFFIFNERGACFFQNNTSLMERYQQTPKKFIVVSNTGRENFEHVFKMHVQDDADILFLSPSNYQKSSVKGDLMKSKQARLAVENFVGEINEK